VPAAGLPRDKVEALGQAVGAEGGSGSGSERLALGAGRAGERGLALAVVLEGLASGAVVSREELSQVVRLGGLQRESRLAFSGTSNLGRFFYKFPGRFFNRFYGGLARPPPGSS
jgi:hypothetical protein